KDQSYLLQAFRFLVSNDFLQHTESRPLVYPNIEAPAKIPASSSKADDALDTDSDIEKGAGQPAGAFSADWAEAQGLDADAASDEDDSSDEAEAEDAEPDVLARQLSGAMTMEDTMAAYLLRTPRFFSSNDARLGGYGGVWTFFRGGDASPEELEHEFRAYRCFCLSEDRQVLQVRFFHETPPTGTTASQREQDGLYESLSSRALSDPYFSCSTALASEEVAEHRHPCFFWRIIPWTENFLIRMSLELPPESSKLMNGFSSDPLPGAVDPLTIVNSTWALEAFLDDGATRWSVGPIYSIHNRRLKSNFTIREHVTVIRPSQPIDFRELPTHPLRPRLSADPSTWLTGSWQGVMQEGIFDEDGNMIRVKARPTQWHPPDEHDPEYTLVRYPDSVYGYFPRKLPSLIHSDDCTQSNSISFEVGGIMREVREFRRMILRYSGDGKPESLTMEWYSPTRTRSQRTLTVLRSATESAS
ncbi:hypothetical protein WJX84_000431, partial [Apatococcus fuscideae]